MVFLVDVVFRKIQGIFEFKIEVKMINDKVIQNSKKNRCKQLILFIFLIILFFGGQYLLNKWDRNQVWSSNLRGIVVSFDANNGRKGYYYYTNNNDVVVASYFFKDYNSYQQLDIGDSIYKPADSFKLYIYKKNDEGKYVFDRMEMKFDDTVSPYKPL